VTTASHSRVYERLPAERSAPHLELYKCLWKVTLVSCKMHTWLGQTCSVLAVHIRSMKADDILLVSAEDKKRGVGAMSRDHKAKAKN
jgi:hypothetical protein